MVVTKGMLCVFLLCTGLHSMSKEHSPSEANSALELMAQDLFQLAANVQDSHYLQHYYPEYHRSHDMIYPDAIEKMSDFYSRFSTMDGVLSAVGQYWRYANTIVIDNARDNDTLSDIIASIDTIVCNDIMFRLHFLAQDLEKINRSLAAIRESRGFSHDSYRAVRGFECGILNSTMKVKGHMDTVYQAITADWGRWFICIRPQAYMDHYYYLHNKVRTLMVTVEDALRD